MPSPWRLNALRSDGQVVPSSCAAALMLPSRSASWKARRRVPGLGGYGFVATFQPDPHFGRHLALVACGGVFVAGSLAWGLLVDGFRPDRYDLVGAALCLVGVAVIMYAPRAS